MEPRSNTVWMTMALLGFTVAEAALIYWVGNPALRLVLGVLLLPPIIFVSSQIGVADYLRALVSPTILLRRYLRVRDLVDRLLAEVRRMNSIAVDRERGVRTSEATEEILDDIEEGLHALVGEIRGAAGAESAIDTLDQ